MRLNKFLAKATNLSRRTADMAIKNKRVKVNESLAKLGQKISKDDNIALDNSPVIDNSIAITIRLNKPVGYVCSRDGQGSKTIYELLPANLQRLNPIGRLDKNSSGLLLMTNDGELAQKLSHPRYRKKKIYKVVLNKVLPKHLKKQIEDGVLLDDGISTLALKGEGKTWQISMHEGTNRQIRRTFEAIGLSVVKLHRVKLDTFEIGKLEPGKFDQLKL
jgi:23S rRNA pseudouridine2605 synthase